MVTLATREPPLSTPLLYYVLTWRADARTIPLPTPSRLSTFSEHPHRLDKDLCKQIIYRLKDLNVKLSRSALLSYLGRQLIATRIDLQAKLVYVFEFYT